MIWFSLWHLGSRVVTGRYKVACVGDKWSKCTNLNLTLSVVTFLQWYELFRRMVLNTFLRILGFFVGSTATGLGYS